VREALHTLQQDGLVEAVPRAGYIVSAITTRDVNELFQLRLILETAAAELAAQNATREELEQIKQAADFRYVYGEPDSYAEFLSRNTKFHHRVAMASGNERLAEILLRLLEDLERLFNLELDVRDSAEEMVAEHVDLVGALLERDSQKARQIMADQIRSSEQRVLEAIVGHAGPGVTLEL
jgi:DNA-binding GntR family transcriptional regulator